MCVQSRCQVSHWARLASSAWLGGDKDAKLARLQHQQMWATPFVSFWRFVEGAGPSLWTENSDFWNDLLLLSPLVILIWPSWRPFSYTVNYSWASMGLNKCLSILHPDLLIFNPYSQKLKCTLLWRLINQWYFYLLKYFFHIPSHPVGVTSAKGLSHWLHWRPITPPLQGHWPVMGSQVRDSEPIGKQSQG